MTGSPQAVFLSYASEDAAASRRLCEALRAAGMEVWFDQSELRGGDAWDAAIRRQIKACALFVPIISANAHAREEGYFRLEWKLAIDRSHLMAGTRAFLLPVVIDETSQLDERIPDRFRELQWSRLREGETPPAFVEHVQRLLSPDDGGSIVPAPPPAAVKPPAAAGARSPEKPATAPWWYRLAMLFIVALVVIAIGYTAIDRLLPQRRAGSAGEGSTQPAPPTASSAPDKSIAVLPFVDMSEKHDQEYFSDGLSEELIDRLARNADLSVIARTSSFAFKGRNEDLRTIASRLGVAHLLEGSVRKAGNTMRVTAQLIRARGGVHLWSDSFDRDLKDVFKVQDEIAAAVVTALQAKLLAVPAAAPAGPRNVDAYNLYLRGQYLARRASNEDVDEGIAILKQAIALQPDFAPAHAELAAAYLYVATFGSAAEGSMASARAEVDRALRLDPKLQSARNVRVTLAILDWDWATARSQLDEILASGPGNSEALLQRGSLARALGHSEESLAYRKRALQLDPLSVLGHVQLAMLLDGMGRTAEARSAAESAIAVNPSAAKAHLLIGLFELGAGHPDAASAAMEQESGEYYRLEGRAIVAFARGQRAESDRALKELIAKYQGTADVQVAQAYAYRGDREQAFEWLDRALEHKDPGMINVKTDPLFASLRGDARFKSVLRKMNLPES